MVKADKTKEQFHYFNIQSEVDSVYGYWAVSKDGDVVNYLFPYVILAFQINDVNWQEKLKKKIWFKPECEDNLYHALNRAKEILSSKKGNK